MRKQAYSTSAIFACALRHLKKGQQKILRWRNIIPAAQRNFLNSNLSILVCFVFAFRAASSPCISIFCWVNLVFLKWTFDCLIFGLYNWCSLKGIIFGPKAVKRLLYVVNKTNDCFKMHLTLVGLRASSFHY